MKQKRKVKSLLPQKNDWCSSFLTAVLLILSVALCIGSASLITSRVRAVEPGEIGVFDYNGLDEKQEVIYGMRFVDPGDMRTVINTMYIKGKSFYITPNSVIVNPMSDGSNIIDTNVNEVEPGVYGHVLGGYKNKVKSDNVTLIAGENNVVTEGNANAAFLGGQSNNNFGRMREGGTPMVVVGGSNNSIGDDHDGVALIGGERNKIWDNVSDSFILGGEDNEIGTGRTNVIVGGKKVKVRNVDNVFVYSNKGDGTNPNDEFEPQSSDSFYLNVGNGVGINTNPSNRGLAVGGVVNLGEIDIVTLECNEDNLGVEGKVSNCVVGCTKASLPRGQWEMLDRGVECQAVCGGIPGNRCIFTGEVIEPAPSYDSYCTPADFTGHSHMCYEDELEEYGNSVFETSLIDSDKECPASDENENKCVYQCDDGYHLTGNVTGGKPGTYRCYKDCEYQWENGEKIIYKHNETVTGYNVNIVACSNNVYMFPFDTEIIPAGTRTREGLSALIPAGISIGNKVINGRTYNNRATNGYSPETCGNYDHKKTLVCNNGTMYLTKNDGKKATNMKASDYGYKYNDCDTANYRCKTGTGEYQFTKTDITNSFSNSGLQDSGNGWDNKKDRQEFDLTRGRYKLCLDYDKVEGNNEICNVVDGTNPHEEHYKFVRCQDGYDEYPTGSKKCMQKCTVKTDDGATVTINHAAIYEFYLKGSETCTGVCIGQNFECNDGTFYSTGADHKKRQDSNYKYSKCMLNKFRCDKAEYNVTYYQWNNLNWKAKGHYSSCDDYDPDPSNGKNAKACKKVETNYKLDYCYEGYHTEDMRECIDNVHLENCEKPKTDPANWYWVRSSGPIQTYPWSNIITVYKSYVDEGMYFKRWSDSCSWNDPASLCWVDEYPDGNNDGKVVPGEACEWRCKKSYVKNANGDGCRYIETTCKYPNNDDNACVNTEPYDCEDVEAEITDKGVGAGEGEWRWKCYNGVRSDACLLCKDGYHKEVVNGVEVCVENKDAKCGTTHYNCAPGKADDRNSNEAKWRWNCLALDSNGYGCTQSRDDEGCYECRYGYHTTSTYGECEEDTAKLYYHNNGKSKAILPTPNPETMRYTKQTRVKDMDDIEGYKFVKWCTTTNGQGGRCYTAGQEIKKAMDVPAEDIHLYAIWEENTATLTYDATNCGGSTWDVTMYYSSKTTADDIRSDEVDGCYTFDGQWCDDRWSCYDPGDIVKYADEEPENMTLYAQCTQKEYTITYNPNGGKWSDLTTTNRIYNNLPCGGNITLEGKPSKDYNNFKGWKSSLSSENSLYPHSSSYTIKDNVTMTAQWEEISYSCGLHHYECGGGVEATNKDTPYNSTKWTWNCGYKDCHECRDGYDDDGNGNCIKNQDGECDYSKTEPACENGVAPHISADFSDAYGAVTVWTCPAMGNGTAAICGASWRCEGGGTCKARENVNFCGYVGRAGSDHFDINNKSNCINAGAYGIINPLSVKGRCYIESNVFTYSMDSCEAVAGQGYSYSSCFEWEEDASSYTLTCNIMDDNGNLNVPSSESSCRPIESKKPKCDGSELKINGECGEKVNTCVAGDFMDIEDDVSNIKWVCKGIGSNSTTASCTKYIPAQSSDGYYQLTWNYINGCGACPWWECDSSQEGWRYTRFKTIEGCEDARLWYGGRLHPSGNESLWCSSCKYYGSSSGGGSSSSAMIKNPAVESKCTYSSSLPGLPKIYSSNSDCINDNIWKYGAVVNGVYKSNITSQSQCPTGTCIPCATCSG